MVDFKKLARLSISKAALVNNKIGCHEQGHDCPTPSSSTSMTSL